MGKFIAKAVLDNRMVDLPFSLPFYQWLLREESTLTSQDLRNIDPTIASTISQLEGKNLSIKNFSPWRRKRLKTFPAEAISSLITRIALILVSNFMPQQNQNVTSILLHLRTLSKHFIRSTEFDENLSQ